MNESAQFGWLRPVVTHMGTISCDRFFQSIEKSNNNGIGVAEKSARCLCTVSQALIQRMSVKFVAINKRRNQITMKLGHI